MSAPTEIRQPDRRIVITALGAAQILAWGTSFYFPAVFAGPIVADTGWSLGWVVSGTSVGLMVAGLVSPQVGRIIDRHGGRPVLLASSLLYAAGLAGIGLAPALPFYLAAWVVLGLGMGTGLYDAVFAALGRMYGHGARGPITSIWSKQFYETDPARDFVRGYTLQFGRGAGPATEAITSAATGRLPWGRDHHRVYRELLNHRVGVGVACDDLPEAHNCVTLDPDLKDSNGIPAPRIDYTISENTRRMMEHGIARGAEILAAAGATRVHTSRTALNYPGHLLGTARMGFDPERSVVNEWGRSHDVKNLFIVDGSVFVTGGGVNPTSTIQALALHIADQMKRRLATLFD